MGEPRKIGGGRRDVPVSAVIPVFDHGRYLGEAIESVLGQTHTNTEIIVVSDGSTDETAAVARSFGERILFLDRPHEGIGPTRNAGLERATADHFAFLDADDVWEPRKLEWQLDALLSDPEVDLVYGHARQYYSPEVSHEFRRRKGFVQEIIPAPIATSLLTSREAFYRVGRFGFENIGVDQAWKMRADEAGLRPLMLPQVVYHRRIHENNNGVRAAATAHSERLAVLKQALDRRRIAKPSDAGG